MNASCEPMPSGGADLHSTALMFSYQARMLSGSDAYAATAARGRRISISLVTSTIGDSGREHDAVAARALGLVQRAVGARDERLGALLAVPRRDADRDRLPADRRQPDALDDLQHALGAAAG